VLDTCKRLEKSGFEVTLSASERDGRVNPQAVADALTDRTIVVCIMLANNEVGTIKPGGRRVGQVVKGARGRLLSQCDGGPRRRGQDPFDVATPRNGRRSGFLSAHKMYGSQGRGRASTCGASRGCASPPSSTAAATRGVACARAH